MTVEGRLARGKANHEAGIFLENSETLEYIASITKQEPVKQVKEKPKPVKEVEDAKPDK